jgi:hypothetical protein
VYLLNIVYFYKTIEATTKTKTMKPATTWQFETMKKIERYNGTDIYLMDDGRYNTEY